MAIDVMRRSMKSTFLLTIVLVVALDFLFAHFQPLRFFDVTEFIPLEQNPLVLKLRTFLGDHSKNPEILMLGSSLILFPSTRTDEEMDGKPHRYDHWYIRHRVSADTLPRYFNDKLNTALNKKLTVCNLGVQGSIVSDQTLILRKALEYGKTPKLVILELAPRSFLDNMHKQIRNTPVFQVLGDFAAGPPLFENGGINKQALVALPGYISYYYKVKADYRTLVANITAAALNRPMNGWESKEGIKRRQIISLFNPEMEWQVSEKPLVPKYHDLAMYDYVYNPPDPAFFTSEEEDCKRLLATAKNAGIKVIVVDMPVTTQNRKLIKPEFLARYKQFIQTLAGDKSISVISLSERGEFNDDDFEDSAHLNASGGKKLFSALSQAIEADVSRGELSLNR